MRPRGKSSNIDMVMKNANKTPGPGFYDLKSIDTGLAKTTLGASRGWK
jgi:hypothetical protein